MSKKVLMSALLALTALSGFSSSAIAHPSTLMVHTHQNVISAAGVSVAMPSQLMSRLKVTMPPQVLSDPRATARPGTVGLNEIAMPCPAPYQTLKLSGTNMELRQDCTSEVPSGPVMSDVPLFWSIMEAAGIGRVLSIFGLVR